MGRTKSESGTGTVVKSKDQVREPRQFKVVLLNDDYTTMDFVVAVLESIFGKSHAEAVQVMFQVHTTGKGLCGIFSKQIAEVKIALVRQRAQAEGFPLQATMEEA